MNEAADVVNPDALCFDERGLIPAIVQEARTGEVLMLAYMNRESVARTLETGETWFWSRSRQALWHKGGTSGHTQRVRWLRVDCDRDTLLVGVEQSGAGACHIPGRWSCFAEPLEDTPAAPAPGFEVLPELARLIAQRNAERPEGSYTTKLFAGGVDRIGKKVGEEAVEVVIAAKNRVAEAGRSGLPDTELPGEVADLVYHLLVLAESVGLGADEVLAALGARRGTPGRHANSDGA